MNLKLKNTLKILLIMSFLPVFTHCEKHLKAQPHIVNKIHLLSLGYNIQDVLTQKSIVNYFYANGIIYIVSADRKTLLGFNSNGERIFELGKLRGKTKHTPKIWEKQMNQFLEKMKDSSSDSKKSEQINISEAEKKFNAEEGVNKQTNIFKVHKKYNFDAIGQIGIDFHHNIYIENKINLSPTASANKTLKTSATYLDDNKKQNSKSYKIEILKFSPRGNLLYRLGMEGRDNSLFTSPAKIIKLYFNNQGAIFVKYRINDQEYLRFYTGYGKNTHVFEKSKIKKMLLNYFHSTQPKKAKLLYKVENILPVDSSTVVVSMNIYKSEDKKLNIFQKKIFYIDANYHIKNIWNSKDPLFQMYSIGQNKALFFFSYDTDVENYIVQKYSVQGKLFSKEEHSMNYSYYRRIDFATTQQGYPIETFLRKSDIIFVIWY